VEEIMNKYYFEQNHKMSSALDILASYIKGQKIIYMESKYYSEFNLNCLMMPAILLSTSATVLSSYANNYKFIGIVISIFNGIIAFLLSIVNLLKLDAASQAFKISAHQYDKLQSSVEFTSGTVLLFKNENNFDRNDKNDYKSFSDGKTISDEKKKKTKEKTINYNMMEKLKDI